MPGRPLSRSAASRGGHGKLPTAGDFVSFGLAPGLRRRWDDWLGAVCEASRDTVPDEAGAAERWAGAPTWQLAAAPGLLGASAVVAVVAPSRDRVGRRFPFSLLAEADHGAVIALLEDTPPGWFAGTRELLAAAVAGELAPGELPAALAELAPPTDAGGPAPTAVPAEGAASLRKLAAAPRGVVLRCVDGPPASAVLWAPTLPTGRLAAALVDRGFEDRGWRSVP
jgi:type VI secretion system protein ImpM